MDNVRRNEFRHERVFKHQCGSIEKCLMSTKPHLISTNLFSSLPFRQYDNHQFSLTSITIHSLIIISHMNNSQRLSIDETIEYFIDRNEIFIFLQISFHLMNIFLFTQRILIMFLYQKGIFRIVHLDYRSEKKWIRMDTTVSK